MRHEKNDVSFEPWPFEGKTWALTPIYDTGNTKTMDPFLDGDKRQVKMSPIHDVIFIIIFF